MIEAGEKLYPDTAAHGREAIRQNLRSAKEDWEKLFSSLNDTQRRVDSFLLQWSSYAEGQDQLVRWIGDTEATLRGDVDLKNTLQEKRMQLQNHRVGEVLDKAFFLRKIVCVFFSINPYHVKPVNLLLRPFFTEK